MKSQLSIVNEAVMMPGVAFFANGIIFEKELTVEQLNQLSAKVAEMYSGMAWWLGDIGLAIQQKKGDDYRRGRAQIIGIDEGHWANCVMVARFFPPSSRDEGRGWKHHLEAMRGAGGAAKGELKKAINWLAVAKEHNWKVTEMRREVGLSLATIRPPTTRAEANPFEPIDRLDAWLGGKPTLPEISPADARNQLVRWQAIVEFVHQLESIALMS